MDRVITGTDDVGKTRTYGYDKNGNLSEDKLVIAGQTVDRTTYSYDNSDRRTAENRYGKGGTAAVTGSTYDKRGNATRITDPDGYSLAFDYDEADRPIRAYDQEGNQVYTWRDLDGRPRCSVDPNGNVIHYTYWDSTRNSLLKRVTQPAPGSCPGSAPTSGVRALRLDVDDLVG